MILDPIRVRSRRAGPRTAAQIRLVGGVIRHWRKANSINRILRWPMIASRHHTPVHLCCLFLSSCVFILYVCFSICSPFFPDVFCFVSFVVVCSLLAVSLKVGPAPMATSDELTDWRLTGTVGLKGTNQHNRTNRYGGCVGRR